MSRTRAKFVTCIVVVSTLCAIVAGTVTVVPGDTITLSNRFFSFSLNVGGIFDLVAGGSPVENKGQVSLFLALPDDTPESAFISLDARDIEFIPLLALKGQPTAQLANGTTELTIKIASGSSLDPCAEGVVVGTFILTFNNGTITVDRARLRLPAAAFLHILTGSFTICLEMHGDINGQIIIDGMGIEFGPSAGGRPGGNQNDNGSGGCASDAHCSGVEVCENGNVHSGA